MSKSRSFCEKIQEKYGKDLENGKCEHITKVASF